MMPRRALGLAAALVVVLASATAAPATEDEGPPRFSLPTESDRAAWLRPGFRFALGAGYGRLFGLGGAPSGNLFGPTIRLGLRLDERWSLLASFQYLFGFGVRFGGTLEPTWHVTRRLSLAVGLGFGSLVGSGNGREDPSPQRYEVETSYTFPDASTPFRGCSGAGLTGLVRGEYLFVLGPRSSTGAALEIFGQWTGCVDDTGDVEADSATPIVRRQWWPHLGLSLSWMVAWR